MLNLQLTIDNLQEYTGLGSKICSGPDGDVRGLRRITVGSSFKGTVTLSFDERELDQTRRAIAKHGAPVNVSLPAGEALAIAHAILAVATGLSEDRSDSRSVAAG